MNLKKTFLLTLFFSTLSLKFMSAQELPQTLDLYQLNKQLTTELKKEIKDLAIDASFKDLIKKLNAQASEKTNTRLIEVLKDLGSQSTPSELEEISNQIELICSMSGLKKSLIAMILLNKFDDKNYQAKELKERLLSELIAINEYVTTLSQYIGSIMGNNSDQALKKPALKEKSAILEKIKELNIQISKKQSLLESTQRQLFHARLNQELESKRYQTRSENQDCSDDLEPSTNQNDFPITTSLEEKCQKIESELADLLNQAENLESEIASTE